MNQTEPNNTEGGLDLLLSPATRWLPWNVRIQVYTEVGTVDVPVRHPNRIEADGVNLRPGGLLGVFWFAWQFVRRLIVGVDRSNRAVERRILATVLGAFDLEYRHLIEAMPMGEVMQIATQIEEAQSVFFEFARSHARSAARQVLEDQEPAEEPTPDQPAGPDVRLNPDGTITRTFGLRVGQPVPGQFTGGKRVVLGESHIEEAPAH